MEPTLPIGTRLSVERGLTPRVGEIVAFRAPAGALPVTPVCAAPGQGGGFASPCGAASVGASAVTLVKRIVAGPGATSILGVAVRCSWLGLGCRPRR